MNTEGLSVREMECHMDVEMFLEGHAGWEAPIAPSSCTRCSNMPQSKGWKEVECMICWGCQHGLPKLDPKADISAVQLVGPQTSKEEFRALYYKVYKLRRLPGSPLGGRMNRGTHCRDGVLPRRPPGMEVG